MIAETAPTEVADLCVRSAKMRSGTPVSCRKPLEDDAEEAPASQDAQHTWGSAQHPREESNHRYVTRHMRLSKIHTKSIHRQSQDDIQPERQTADKQMHTHARAHMNKHG